MSLLLLLINILSNLYDYSGCQQKSVLHVLQRHTETQMSRLEWLAMKSRSNSITFKQQQPLCILNTPTLNKMFWSTLSQCRAFGGSSRFHMVTAAWISFSITFILTPRNYVCKDKLITDDWFFQWFTLLWVIKICRMSQKPILCTKLQLRYIWVTRSFT